MTQKSESVREAEQRKLCEGFVDRVVNLTDAEGEIEQQIAAELAEELRMLLDAHAKSVTLKLAEEAEQEAEAHYNIAPPHRYHADLDQCKFKRAVAAWLREKAR